VLSFRARPRNGHRGDGPEARIFFQRGVGKYLSRKKNDAESRSNASGVRRAAPARARSADKGPLLRFPPGAGDLTVLFQRCASQAVLTSRAGKQFFMMSAMSCTFSLLRSSRRERR